VLAVGVEGFEDLVGGLSSDKRAFRNAGCSRGLNVMSRDIVHRCVSGHRGQSHVSGLRGRWRSVGPVPAATVVGFGVLRDRLAGRVVDLHDGGVPGDGDLLALALVAGIELARQSPDLAAFGHGSRGCAGDPGRWVLTSALHQRAGGSAGPCGG
jgi:hypothetical protein